MSVESKFARQVQLSEIGSEGQYAISQSSLMVNGSADEPTIQFAKLYAHAAGFPASRLEETAWELPAELRAAFRYGASRSVGLGASYALASVLKALNSCHVARSSQDPSENS